jgi:hypothetical protein
MATLKLGNRSHPALEKAKAKAKHEVYQETLKLVPKPEPKPIPDNVTPITKPAKKKRKPEGYPEPLLDIEGHRSLYWYANNQGLNLTNEELKLAGITLVSLAKERGLVMGSKSQMEGKHTFYVRTYPVPLLEEWLEGNKQSLANAIDLKGG